MSSSDSSSIACLEGVAFRAWPAHEVLTHGSWRLRFMDGVSSRGNSAFTSLTESESEQDGTPSAEELEQRILAVERFYAERGQPPIFHLSPTSKPNELDAALQARGYRIEKPVSVRIAALSELVAASTHEVEISETLDSRWFELAGGRSRFAARQSTYRELLLRLGGRARFALATLDGRPAATALGVRDGAWFGIHSVLTQPESRRRGLATALLASLTQCARAEGATNAYLLVETENTLALDLYARAGFREAYRTHYRSKRP